jgi:hypothetical protein
VLFRAIISNSMRAAAPIMALGMKRLREIPPRLLHKTSSPPWSARAGFATCCPSRRSWMINMPTAAASMIIETGRNIRTNMSCTSK